MLLAVWCLLSLVAVAMGADEPRKCCFDKEFSVVLGEAGGTVNHGQASSLDGTVQVGYDFYRKRQGSITTMRQTDGTTKTTYTLQDYASRMSYVTEENGDCHMYRMSDRDQMYPPCVPDNATYLGPAAFGYGTELLDINAWEFTIPYTDLVVKLAVSADGCVPIVEALYGHFGEANTEVSFFFTGYHPGIEHLNALDAPQNCQMVQANNTAGGLVGRRSLGNF